jgi:hypothetical protein
MPTFAKLNEWPEFARYLSENYRLAISREFDAEKQHAYRIYERNGTSFPALEKDE